MSKLRKYLELSCKDNKINLFREMNIGLVEEKTENQKIIEEIENKFEIKTNLVNLIEEMNKNVGKLTNKKLMYDFLTEDINVIKKAKLNKKKAERIQINCLKLNDYLCKIKDEVEEKLREV